MPGVAVSGARRMVEECDDRFEEFIARMLFNQNLKLTFSLLRQSRGQIAPGTRRPEGTLTMHFPLTYIDLTCSEIRH